MLHIDRSLSKVLSKTGALWPYYCPLFSFFVCFLPWWMLPRSLPLLCGWCQLFQIIGHWYLLSLADSEEAEKCILTNKKPFASPLWAPLFFSTFQPPAAQLAGDNTQYAFVTAAMARLRGEGIRAGNKSGLRQAPMRPWGTSKRWGRRATMVSTTVIFFSALSTLGPCSCCAKISGRCPSFWHCSPCYEVDLFSFQPCLLPGQVPSVSHLLPAHRFLICKSSLPPLFA